MSTAAQRLGRVWGLKCAAQLLEQVGEAADAAFYEGEFNLDSTAADEEKFYDDFVAAALDALSENI